MDCVVVFVEGCVVFFFKQKTAYEMRISDWSSDVCSSDLHADIRRCCCFIHQETVMPFQGSCHCGAVRFTVNADPPTSAISCNCLHCRRKGFLLSFFPADVFTLDAGADDLQPYRSEEHTSELQSLMRRSYAVFCLKKKKKYE